LEAVGNRGTARLGWIATTGENPGEAVQRDMGSVIKKRRKRMAKKKHRKLLKKTRVQRRNKK
jgi:hypothetical protein